MDEVGITNGRYPDGTKTDKQRLREELTAAYGVMFGPQPSPTPSPSPTPTPAPVAITTLSPNNALAGSNGFTLTVDGTGFQNGAFVTFGNRKATTFINNGRVSAVIPAADIVAARTVAVTLTNPDGGVSASKPFVVQAANGLPAPVIVSARYVRRAVPPPNPGYYIAATEVTVSIDAPRAAGTSLAVELQKAGSNVWTLVGQQSVTETPPTATASENVTARLPLDTIAGDSVRARLSNGASSSPYSNVFVLRVP